MSDNSILTAIEAFDLEGYLQDHGFRALRQSEWVGDCPHCGKEDKVAVNIEKKSFHCWVCQEFSNDWSDGAFRRRPVSGAGGLIALIQWLDEVDKEEAVQTILDDAVLDLTKPLDKPLALEAKLVGDVNAMDIAPAIAPPECWAPITHPLPYMLQRGITMEDVATFGLFWCPDGRYRNRLIFPVWEHGRLVYWQGRAMWEKSESPGKFIKALNPPRTEGAKVSSEVLMNIDLACRFTRVAIVEGPMDVIRTGPDAVCTFGKQLHPRQIQLLRERGVQAVDLMWDGPTPSEPEGAHVEMLNIAPQLSQFFQTRLVFLPSGDPGDWDRGSLTAMREASEAFSADLGAL